MNRTYNYYNNFLFLGGFFFYTGSPCVALAGLKLAI